MRARICSLSLLALALIGGTLRAERLDIIALGAKGDGITKNTAIIQRAIDSVTRAGGGTVFIPAGTFVSGTLYLRSHVTLELSAGATLLASPDRADYNADDFCPQNQVFAQENVSGAHFIVALEAEHVTICGQGRIDGNRKAFMNEPDRQTPAAQRPRFKRPTWRPAQMLYFCESNHLRVQGVELFNAPYWTCFFHGCEHVFADGLRIYTDPRGYNNDGIDIDSCSHVVVSNCDIETEDDSITLRGNPRSLKNPNRVCEYVTVSNCILQSPCNALRIGVGTGVVRRCLLNNIAIHNTRTGICLIAAYNGKGGCTLEDITLSNFFLDCLRPVMLASDTAGPNEKPCVPIRDITFSEIHAKGRWTSSFFGNADCNTRNIRIDNSVFEYSGGEDIPQNLPEKHGIGEFGKYRTGDSALQFQNIQGLRLNHVTVRWNEISGPWKKAIKTINVSDAEFRDCELPDAKP